ncbi:MAG: glutaredoxin domain-containing protein [Candidatus Pacebacteria bacterium]|nr:glutaredoxin domain-containing protein [Candidatus Paceibacterota bacterium]
MPNPNIKVFSTEFCPYCVALKEFLKENNIEFEAVDVTQDIKAQEEMIKKSGQMGVPVVIIDNEVIIGFDREKISKILKLET